jgi:hypothetical protein
MVPPGGMQSQHNRRAIVIGGSIAGLFVAAFLRRTGWQVDIYERSSIELLGRGVGIFAGHFELLEALDKCGAGTVDIGVMAYRRIAVDRTGAVIAERPMLQIVTSWDRLRQLLARAIDRQRYRFAHVFEHVEQYGQGVHVHFTNGHTEHGDLLVACDGIRSSVRAQLAPDVQPIYSGYYLWRGAPNEYDLSPETLKTVFPYFSFFLDEQLQVLGYPISGAQALANCDDIDRGLAAYNAQRQPLSERIVMHGRKLGTQLGVDLRTDEERRISKLLQNPEAILSNIGVPNFVTNQL